MPVTDDLVDQIARLDPQVLLAAIARCLDDARPDAPACCPNCGIDWRMDKIIRIDGFTIDPREGVWYGDRRLKLTKTQRRIMNSLAKERGRWLSYEQLANRCTDLHHSDFVGAMKMHVCHLRNRLKLFEVPLPIKTERGCGYYWEISGS